jgi:cysteine desulfurase
MTIYLDYNATAPVDPRVLDAALPYFRERFGNASSNHSKGKEARVAMENARRQVADSIGASTDEIVFTSGGSESNNMVLKGIFMAPEGFCRGHMIISSIEHAAISQPARYLEKLGVNLTVLPCSAAGLVDPGGVARALRPDTRLVSVMHANNEIGSIQPIPEISSICRKNGVPLHSDAAQSIGKTEVDVDKLGVDFLTIAGHKVYAPKGVGALYIRNGRRLHPLIQGVGHEGGLRAGTENVAYQVALGTAMQLASDHGQEHWGRMAERRDRLYSLLVNGIGEGITQNGADASRLPNTLSVNFPRISGTALLSGCPEICASTSAACHSGMTTRTVTQKAIGLAPETAAGTIRFSLGWHTTDEEIEKAAGMLIKTWWENHG